MQLDEYVEVLFRVVANGAMSLVEAVHDLAIDVELQLEEGGVADADGIAIFHNRRASRFPIR